MNVENILKVADAIERGAVRNLGFNMAEWMARDGYDDMRKGHSCGTTACIAGWAIALSQNRRSAPRNNPRDILPYDTEGDAAAFLGIDLDAAEALFFAVGASRYQSREHITAAHAVVVLRNLAATGEVDWSITPPGLLSTAGDEK